MGIKSTRTLTRDEAVREYVALKMEDDKLRRQSQAQAVAMDNKNLEDALEKLKDEVNNGEFFEIIQSRADSEIGQGESAMGWNKGYTIFESMVVDAYDLGKLDKDLLGVLMEPFRGTDIDSGGSQGLESKDGKGVKQIVIETWGLEMPKSPSASEDQNVDVWDDYLESIYKKMKIVTDHFGWR